MHDWFLVIFADFSATSKCEQQSFRFFWPKSNFDQQISSTPTESVSRSTRSTFSKHKPEFEHTDCNKSHRKPPKMIEAQGHKAIRLRQPTDTSDSSSDPVFSLRDSLDITFHESFNKMTLLEGHYDPKKATFSQVNDPRWTVSKKQNALFSTTFDENIGNDSFASTLSTISSSTVDEDSPLQMPSRKRIYFADTVHVREFEVIVGDDRVCDYPMTFSWKPLREHLHNLEERDVERRLLDEQWRHWCGRIQKKRNGDKAAQNYSRFRPRRLSTAERRERLRYFGCSNIELINSIRKRKTRLSLDYAYGRLESVQALQAFRDQEHRYII